MTYDTQFAPNPFYGILTLATCKPVIRRKAEIGDWISGWTAVEVRDKENRKHSFKDGQKMIYLARVKDKVTFAEYWDKYPEKRPVLLNADEIKKNWGGSQPPKPLYNSGDNIYEPCFNNDESGKITYRQVENGAHGKDEYDRDLSGEYVLICEEFYYFGVDNALSVPQDIFNYKVPRSKKIKLAEVDTFVEYIQNNFKSSIIEKV